MPMPPADYVLKKACKYLRLNPAEEKIKAMKEL